MRGFLYWSAYNNIAETIHMDAAPGRIHNGNPGACGNALAKASRDAEATPELFMQCARQYLSTADARTCTLASYDPIYHEECLGFKTRRLGDYLYVTEATQEERLKPGMRVPAVGLTSVPDLLKDTGYEIFWGRYTDREDWDLCMRMFDTIDVFPGDGTAKRFDLKYYPVEAVTPILSCERRGDTAVLRIDSLEDADAVRDLIESTHDVLAGADRLVLDVRHCAGEADPESYLVLLPYLCDADIAARDVIGDTDVYTIYSKNNAKLLLDGLESARPYIDEETLAMIDELAGDIQTKADEVLAAKRELTKMHERRVVSEVPETVLSPFEDEEICVAADAPAHVVMLVDTSTGIGAERLAEAVMGMDKVVLAGRATPGAVDYANFVTRDYDEILAKFTYPISRTVANHDGGGYTRTGLPLDVHIPFTPEECERDVMLERALEA